MEAVAFYQEIPSHGIYHVQENNGVICLSLKIEVKEAITWMQCKNVYIKK